MLRTKVGFLLVMIMILMVACGGGGDDDDGNDGDSQSSDGDVAVVTVVWESTGNNSDFADDINIRLGQVWIAGDTVMIDHIRSGDINGYNLRYSVEDGSTLEPLDFMIPREALDSDDIDPEDIFYNEEDGTYWAVTTVRGAPIIHLTEDSEILAEYGVSPAFGEDAGDGEIQGGENIFIAGDGNIYVNESITATSGQITVLSADGEVIREFTYNRIEGSQYDMTVSGSDEIVLTPISRRLAEYGFDVYDLEGTLIRDDVGIGMAIEETRTTSSTPTLGVHLDSAGNAVFVTRYHLYRVNSDGEITHIYDAPLAINEQDDLTRTADEYRWNDVVLLPNGDAVALYSSVETWTLVRLSFG